jgi:hypothetical protein
MPFKRAWPEEECLTMRRLLAAVLIEKISDFNDSLILPNADKHNSR